MLLGVKGAALEMAPGQARGEIVEARSDLFLVGAAVADLRALRAFDKYQVLPDGKLIFIQRGELEDGIRQFDLIFGFGEELKRRIP